MSNFAVGWSVLIWAIGDKEILCTSLTVAEKFHADEIAELYHFVGEKKKGTNFLNRVLK